MILSIDPGNEYSAYSLLNEELRPIKFGKVLNAELFDFIENDLKDYDVQYVAVEMVACYGMAVGKTIFDTCVVIGRLYQMLKAYKFTYVYRKDVKMNLCQTMKAKDSNIRQALIDRFGIVGVKKQPGWFYGVSKDVWSAIAVGVTYSDLYKYKGD